MKYLLTTLFFTAFHFVGLSQNENPNYKRSLKIYNLFTYQSSTNTTLDSINSTSSSSQSIKILNPTIAYNWKGKKSNFNEIELITLILSKNYNETTITNISGTVKNPLISGAKIITSIISLRYEYIINFLKGSKSSLLPSLGCAINPYYQHINTQPVTSQSFPTTIINYGTHGFLIPRITYYASTKYFFDFNIPIDVFNLNNALLTVRNPQIPVKSQRTSDWDFSLIPKNFNLRFGIGIKI